MGMDIQEENTCTHFSDMCDDIDQTFCGEDVRSSERILLSKSGEVMPLGRWAENHLLSISMLFFSMVLIFLYALRRAVKRCESHDCISLHPMKSKHAEQEDLLRHCREEEGHSEDEYFSE